MDVSKGSGEVRIDVTYPSSYPYSQSFAGGTVVALEATAPFARVFDGWGGDLSGKNNPEYILIDCNKTVTASFSIDWKLVGTFLGCLILALFLASVLIIRRKAPDSTAPANEE